MSNLAPQYGTPAPDPVPSPFDRGAVVGVTVALGIAVFLYVAPHAAGTRQLYTGGRLVKPRLSLPNLDLQLILVVPLFDVEITQLGVHKENASTFHVFRTRLYRRKSLKATHRSLPNHATEAIGAHHHPMVDRLLISFPTQKLPLLR